MRARARARFCVCVVWGRGGEGPLALPASAGRARWRLSAWPLCERRRRRTHARVKGTSCHRRPRAVPGRLVLVPAVLAAWAAVSPSREAAAESQRPSAEGARSACYSSCCHWRLLSRSNTVDISVGGTKLLALENWLHVRPRARGRRATESRVDVALAHPNTEHCALTRSLRLSVVGGGGGGPGAARAFSKRTAFARALSCRLQLAAQHVVSAQLQAQRAGPS